MAKRMMCSVVATGWLLLSGGVPGIAAAAPPPSGSSSSSSSPSLGAAALGAAAQPPAAPGQRPALTPESVTADTIMAEVNGVKITFGDLSKTVREQIPNVTGHGTISPPRLRQRSFEMLEQMITDELLLQEAKRLHITVDQKQVDAEVKRQRGQFQTEEKYQDALKQRQLTAAHFRQRLERAVLIQQVIIHEINEKVTVTDEDLAAYYRDHQDKFKIPMQYRLRILLVSVDPSATSDEWEQARKRALDYRSRGVKGEDFAALARKFSGDAETRDKGGDTGLIHQGQLGLTDVEGEVEPLKPGEITEPIRTIYGFYLARVEEKRPGRQQTFDELNKTLFRQELTATKRREHFQAWVEALRSRATITRVSAAPGAP
jgi:parvulin-like peptidyl-prolyl isomerase